MTGSLQEKNGIYYAVINLKDEKGKRTQKWINTQLPIKGNKKKAEKILRDTIAEFEKKPTPVKKRVLFVDCIHQWLSSHKNQVDFATWKGYEQYALTQIIPYFENLKLYVDEVMPQHIQKYYDEKFTSGRLDGSGGLSVRTVKLHSVVIKQVLKEAMLNDLITYNPADRAKTPQSDKKFKGAFYTVDQANKLLDVLEGEIIRPIVFITLYYGLRRSEVMGLKWDAVDFENKMLIIKRTVLQTYALQEKEKTKNQSSKRGYPLLPEISEILLAIKAEQVKNKAIFGDTYEQNDYVFTKADGTLIQPNYVTHRFGDIIRTHNLPKLRFHDLRHTCASILLAKGWTLKDIQEWLGHSDIQMTANIYTHLDITRKQSIASNISNTFNL